MFENSQRTILYPYLALPRGTDEGVLQLWTEGVGEVLWVSSRDTNVTGEVLKLQANSFFLHASVGSTVQNLHSMTAPSVC